MAVPPPGLKSHYAVSDWRQKEYLAGVENGTFVPFVMFPMFFYGLAALTLHMLLPIVQGRLLRLATFSVSAAVHSWMILYCRSASPGAGFALGMLSSWNILWAAVVLIFNDAKRDFKMVKRHNKTATTANGHANGNGTANGKLNGRANGHAKPGATNAMYSWQSFPTKSLSDRLGWAIDLVTNFRGIGWSWKITGTPSRPPSVEASLGNIELHEAIKADFPNTSAGRSRFESRGALLRHNAMIFLQGYLFLDLLKTIINHDPYFWGLIDQPPPSYLPIAIQQSEVLTRVYRMAVTLCFLWATLRTVFCLAPLLYAGVIGSGKNGEAWMWPDEFGAYKSGLTRGLAGFWGGWWHQVFRFGFQAGGKWFASDVLRLSSKSPLSAVVQLSTSFNLSGFMHVAVSMTMIGDTRPWSRMFLFFAIQPVGIITGLICTHLLKLAGISRRVPWWMGWIGNFIYIHVWLYYTMPLLADELVQGGLLLFEPVPWSPFRALGLGAPGDKGFCWQSVKINLISDGPLLLRGLSM